MNLSFSASFYGGSYVHVPLQDAKGTTEVQLKFRTKQSDALLLLAAGRTDYCLIRLESGRLKVRLVGNKTCRIFNFKRSLVVCSSLYICILQDLILVSQ